MAAEPYTPFPTVAVNSQPPVNTSVRTDPAMFGGAVAQGEEKLGAGLVQAADTGLDVATRAAELQNQSTANKAFADFNQKVTDLLYKPASAPGEQDGGFFTKQGYNAGAAAEDTKANLQKLFDDQRGTLQNVRQQLQFDTDARRVLTYSMRDIGSHADGQINKADDATMQMSMSHLGQEATQAAQQGDFKHFDEVVQSITGKSIDYGMAKGYGPAWGGQWATKVIGQTVSNAAKQLADAGPDGLKAAAALADRYAPEMDPASLLSIKTALKSRMEDTTANNIARNLVYGTMPGASNIQSVADRINKVEGTAANPASSAVGTGQFINSTWLNTVRTARPDLSGKPDAEILAMRNDPAFASSMTAFHAAQNAATLQAANLPATPGNIYLAHFLGAQGAISALSVDPSTPVASVVSADAVKANPTVLGGNRTVADVLNWSSLQMAGAAPGAVVKDYKAHAIQTALDMFPDDPNMQRKVEGALTRQFAAVQMDAAAQAEAQRNAAATAESGYYRQIFDPTKPFGPAELHAAENDPAFTLYPEKIKAIREASIQEAQRRAKGDEPPGDGPAYSSLFTRVVAPAGSPDKITDIDAVYPMLQSGQISPQGYGKLRAYIEGNRTQAGKNQNQALAGFLKALEPQYKKPGGLMDDPRGLEFYNQARNQAEHAFQDGIKAHIPEGDLVDPKSKDYIGNKISIKPRSLDEVLGDIRRTTGQPGAAPKLAAPAGAPSQFVEGQTYTDAKGNRATYSGGQWLPIPGGPAPGPSANLAPPVR